MYEEEDLYKDDGVAYTEEHFDTDFFMGGYECDGIFDECMYGDEDNARKHCACFRECKAEWEAL